MLLDLFPYVFLGEYDLLLFVSIMGGFLRGLPLWSVNFWRTPLDNLWLRVESLNSFLGLTRRGWLPLDTFWILPGFLLRLLDRNWVECLLGGLNGLVLFDWEDLWFWLFNRLGGNLTGGRSFFVGVYGWSESHRIFALFILDFIICSAFKLPRLEVPAE